MRAKFLLMLLVMPLCLFATVDEPLKQKAKWKNKPLLCKKMSRSCAPLTEVTENQGQLYFNLYYPMSSADILIKDCRNAVVYEEHNTEICYGRTIVIPFVEGEDLFYSYEITSGDEYIIGEVVWEEE